MEGLLNDEDVIHGEIICHFLGVGFGWKMLRIRRQRILVSV